MASTLERLADRARALAADFALDGWGLLLHEVSSLQSGFTGQVAEELANRVWFVAHVCRVHDAFIRTFAKMKEYDFYSAWYDLERVEIEVLDLFRNPFYDLNDFGLPELRDLVTDWQSLFPYMVFLSPEMIIKREVCSICNEDINPWSLCVHRAGKVYAGLIAHRIVKDFEAVSISLVRDPVQKYSVPFTLGEDGSTVDHYDYSIVRFVVDRLRNPFDQWSYEWTEAYHPHEMFSDRDRDQSCPCGSGQVYSACCAGKPGVLRPHIQFSFADAPPSELPDAFLAGYKDRNRPAQLEVGSLPPE